MRPLGTSAIASLIAGYFCGVAVYMALLTLAAQTVRATPPRWEVALILGAIVIFSAAAAYLSTRAFRRRPGVFTGLASGIAFGSFSAGVVVLLVVAVLWLTFGNGPGFYVD